MINIKKDKTFLRKISLLVCFIVLIGFINTGSMNVNADTINSQPSFIVQMNPLSPNPAVIGEDITVSGTITPQPFEATTQKKQIVLVLDVSGSMAGSKITNLKTAAKNFITKMSSQRNVEIGIVAFSSKATINPTLNHYTDWRGNITGYSTTNAKSIDQDYYHKVPNYINSNWSFESLDQYSNVTNLTNMVDDLEALGGTNTGEGLRKAEYMLENGDSTANKSIVFMSDGLPTFYSVNGYNHTYYTTIDDSNPYFAGMGTDSYSYYDSQEHKNAIIDSNQKSKAYATQIGSIIKNTTKPNVFSIGYGLGDENSTGNINMKDIHASMGGTTGDNGTFFATDENAIDGVFNQIADKIMQNYTLSDMKINLESAINFNSSFALNSGDKIVNIGDVNYKLDNNRNDGKIVYEADPIPFSFKIKANATGTYNNVFEGGNITIPWKDQQLSTSIPSVGIVINDNELPIINANIVGQNPNPAAKGDNITLTCEVNPKSFVFNSTTVDTSGPKDVIFVVDTSSSMNDKLNSVKNGLFGKIANNSEIKNAKYGIVTFNSSINDNYISDGLTDNVTTLDAAIKNISSSSDTNRNVGEALEHAKTILSNSGRLGSAKYIVLIASGDVQYTNQQLNDIKNSKFNIITVNLGYINPPTKVNNQIVAGKDEPENNIKNLHYNLISKADNGDNILQKEDKNYFININYSLVTNQNNPNEFFTKEENMNQMNDGNQVHNWILHLVADKLKSGAVQVQVPSYTFKTKLKFNTGGKFDVISGLNSCSDSGYDVETPEFDVTYKLVNGGYVADPVSNKSFIIKIKSETDVSDLKFGPGIVSYVSLSNHAKSTNIAPYSFNLKTPIQILKHGLYKGIIGGKPDIDESTQSLAKGASVGLGADMFGSLDNNSNVKLEIPQEVIINKTINVYTYDDNGTLTLIGTMGQPVSDDIKTTYKYVGQSVTDKKILILYNETLWQNCTKTEYKNKLYVPDDEKDITIKVTDKPSPESPDLPELF